jgi:hypothetical protein
MTACNFHVTLLGTDVLDRLLALADEVIEQAANLLRRICRLVARS